MTSKPILLIVIPCYNEEEVIPEAAERLAEKISDLVSRQRISEKSSLLFVDDGSNDNTWALIEKYQKEKPLVFNGIKLPKNTGHQNALLRGLLYAKDHADVTVSIDADLQDDIDAIDKMLDSCLSGYEIVLGVRSNRKADGFFKRISAYFFYCLMRLLEAELVYNHADFRLMSRKALDALAEYKEPNLFLRAVVPRLGFKTTVVYYERKKRFAGKSKYSIRKMLALAFDGFNFIWKHRRM